MREHIFRGKRDSALRAQEKEPKWISVEDKLPEVDGMVLAHIKYQQPFGGCDTAIDVRYYGAVMYKPGWALVTHWMPLPEPPTDGGATDET